jgi:acyl-CoA synthetase (AMP-forming)/AMP-acid ligase II
MDIGGQLFHWADRRPDASAFLFATRDAEIEGRLTFGSLAARATSFAARLQELDGRGQRAALIFSPGLEFMTAILGCMLAGVVAVPMAPPRRLASRDSADAIVENSAPRFVLTTRSTMTRLRAGLANRPQWQ